MILYLCLNILYHGQMYENNYDHEGFCKNIFFVLEFAILGEYE